MCDWEKGFTLIEALVALAIFSIGFSGIYLFFNHAQYVVTEAQKRMRLNLLANQIAETIAAQTQRSASDPLNPFVSPDLYSGSLVACSYGSTDSRQAWCLQLNQDVGPFNPISGKEQRDIALLNDGTGLIINVTLIAGGGSISAFYSRKLRQK
jgi:prepilin-type N-terminal cleavage/methylation domain-containing protein